MTLAPPADVDGRACTRAEERRWFIDRLRPGQVVQRVATAIVLSGPLDVTRLARAARAVAEIHPELRSAYAEVDGRPRRVAATGPALDLEIGDLPDGADADRHEAWPCVLAEAERPFDLARGPLARISLLRGRDEATVVIALHRIVADEASLDILVDDLISAYDLAATEPFALPRVADGERIADVGRDGAIARWTARLAGAPAALDLPTDRPRPALQSLRAGEERFTIPSSNVERSREVGELEPVLIAAFATLLERYTRQSEIVVGVARSGRPGPANTVGHFADHLVARVRTAGGPSFRELVTRIARTLADARVDPVRFETLVDELRPERDLGRSPIFQASFELLAPRPSRRTVAGVTWTCVDLPRTTSDVDLELVLAPADGRLDGRLVYARDLLLPETVARIASHFVTLLGSLVSAPDAIASAAPLLTEREEAELRARDGAVVPVAHRCLHELFEAQAASTPDATALIADGDRLTYAELDRRSMLLARRLRAHGVGPETLVGVCLERTAELVVGLLGVLRAGGAYVPLDPAYPAARLRAMIDDADIRVVLAHGPTLARLPAPGASVVRIDDGSEVDPAAAWPAPSDANLAYVLFTSGSTGRPKGVAIEHRNAVALIEWARRSFAPDEVRGVLASTSVCFDLSVFEIFLPLSTGGTVILAQNALALRGLEAAAEVTLLNTVPSAMAELLRDGALSMSVRTVCLAGEPLTAALSRRVHEQDGVLRLLDLYGPTETTTYSTWGHVAWEDDAAPTIGRPIDNTRAAVLDPRGARVPVRVAGELYLGGAGVARGYLGRPDLTAERFVPDPFGPPGARAYRTGDLARYRSDGRLEFLGRADHQVKVRGYRVEPGEVEAALASVPGVRECAVVARGEGAERRLVAYVVGEDGLDVAALRPRLAERLPGFMVPSGFARLAALPRTSTGKLDRATLPEPETVAPAWERTLPSTEVERGIARIWRDVLSVGEVGATESFFDLGGHSLLATQVLSRIRAEWGVELPLATVFTSPTVAGLARLVENGTGDGRMPSLRPRARGPTAPLSFAQERLWLMEQLRPGSPAHNIAAAFRLSGALDEAALGSALASVVARHEALRTTFAVADGAPVQIVSADRAVDLRRTDLAHLPPREAARALERIIAEEPLAPFDLAHGPLVRFSLVRTTADEHVLLLVLHHIVADGWSLGVICRELGLDYTAARQGRPSPVRATPVQYVDHALWQREALGGPRLAALIDHWRERLAGVTELRLPTDRPRPSERGFRGAVRSASLSAADVAAVRALARREGVTPFIVLYAALALLLGRHAGQTEVVVGAAVAGREPSGIDDLVGVFVDTLVLRAELSERRSFRELLAHARDVTVDALAHGALPFDRLVEGIHPHRDLGRNPLFQVLFNMYSFPGWDLRLDGVRAELLPPITTGSLFDLTVYAREDADRMQVDLVYDPDLFDGARIAEMAEQYTGLIRQAVADPAAAPAAYSLVTPAAGRGLPDPRAMLAMEDDGTVASRFAEQARAAPERTAVADGDETWSYASLDRRSAQLAHELRARGVGPGDLVAVHTPRSIGLVGALLGVLRSGAAFLILDPAHPPARLAEQIAEAAPRACVALGDPPPETIRRAVAAAHAFAITLPAISAWDAELGTRPGQAPPIAVGPDDLAYVAFTSGTTGRPKGIVGTHRPLAHFLAWQATRFGLGPEDRGTVLSGLGHDPLLRDVFAPLWVGASAWVPDAETAARPELLGRWLADRGITFAHLTPALARLVAAAGVRLPDMRWVFFGGDTLTADTVRAVRALAPRAQLVNFYGTTETPQAMGTHVVGAEGDATGTIPIGVGIPGAQLLVTTDAGGLAGVGELGEVRVRSPYLARGYLRDDAATAERFAPNSWTGVADDRAYRTGDLGRYRPDGEVELAGRTDDQVKIRGYRVELGEVEAHLRSHLSVRECAVAARDGPEGERRIVAYVVARGGGAPTIDELRRYLRPKLPEHMLPASLVLLERIPLTPNGKVDRRALPEPATARPELGRRYVAPRAGMEDTIARIWRDVLGLDVVGTGDNFFDLGGTSLSLVRVHARLRETVEREVSVIDLFRYPDIGSLARYIDRGDGDHAALALAERRIRARVAALGRTWRADGAGPQAVPQGGGSA